MAHNNKTWYEKAVFYHMYPLGMTGAPKQNIETEAESRFGELNLWIPHIKSLNCSAVYIGPLFESSTHGYDTRDYKLVDRRLGTNDDFRTFVRLCHEQEIRVVVDGVFNHTGRDPSGLRQYSRFPVYKRAETAHRHGEACFLADGGGYSR